MILTNYFYKHSTIDNSDYKAIPELVREDYSTPQFMKMFREQLKSIKLDGNVGVIYSAGASLHQAESRICTKDYSNSLKLEDSTMVIKNLTAYMAHKYVGLLSKQNTIKKVDIISKTCASSLIAVVNASAMLSSMVHVIVISEDKIGFDTIRIFDEHSINVIPSDGYAVAVFSNIGSGTNITNCKEEYEYNNNPFMATASGYRSVYTECDIVKVHGTGTEVNTLSENEAFKGKEVIKYKESIGHSQGTSGLLELLITVDDPNIKGKILCVASGLGGFYGSCIINK